MAWGACPRFPGSSQGARALREVWDPMAASGSGHENSPFGQQEKGFPAVWCHLCRQGAAGKGATLTLCEVGVEVTNHIAVVCTGHTVLPADLLIALIGQPVFRRVQARDHPLPCTVVTIQGTQCDTMGV